MTKSQTKSPAKPLPKLVLSSSRDIPFSQLVLSQKNVRRVKVGISIEDLADDIYRRTLLQSLNVRAMLDDDGKETGMFEVPAGGRRFRALELLVKSKRMAKDQPVPCVVREAGIAEEDSLAENVMRVALHPLDQFRAFSALIEAGLSEDDIAARFFVSVSTVRQRLRLASVFAVVDGADGRVHHLKFSDIDMTGDAATGSIVELRIWTDRRGREQSSLWTHSDLDLAGQERSRGSTWLDKQLIASEPLTLGLGFGSEIEAAKTRRLDYLESEGLAQRHGDRFVLSRNLLSTLRERDLAEAGASLSREHNLPYRQGRPHGDVSGVYCGRVQLASGRFAMIDDGLGFSLVPWSKQLDRHLGQYVSGNVRSGGGIEWTLGRSRGIEI